MTTREEADDLEANDIDVDVFALDPFLMGRLSRSGVRVSVVAIFVCLATWISVTWCAAVSQQFYPASGGKSFTSQLSSFLRPSEFFAGGMPLLSDFPSLILGVTIPVSFAVVYDLFTRGANLHGELRAAGCIRFANESQFTAGVAGLNRSLRRWGRFSLVSLAVCAAIGIAISVRQRSGLFHSRDDLDLYKHWWASQHPLEPGFIVWILIAAVGIYTLYIEAVLGVAYVSFMRKYGSNGEFVANPLNPDGYYGWASLRAVINNMQTGVVLTGFSSVALWPFLSGAFGVVPSALFEIVFVGVVGYVFFALTRILRDVIDKDRQRQVLSIQELLPEPSEHSEASVLRGVLAYQRLALVDRMPRSPLRRGSAVILSLSLLAPILEIAVAVLHYYSGEGK